MEKEHEAKLTHSIPLQTCKFRYICHIYYPIPLRAHSSSLDSWLNNLSNTTQRLWII